MVIMGNNKKISNVEQESWIAQFNYIHQGCSQRRVWQIMLLFCSYPMLAMLIILVIILKPLIMFMKPLVTLTSCL